MKLNNTYYMLRHGEAVSNVKNIYSSWPETFENPLTENGMVMAKDAADLLATKQIDLIFSSDVLRAKQTAMAVAEKVGLEIIFDARLREISFGNANGNPVADIQKQVGKYEKPGYDIFGGESYADVSQRMVDFFQEINAKYSGKTIVIVSHQAPLCLLEEAVKDIPLLGITKIPGYEQLDRGQVRELTSASLFPMEENVTV